MSCSNSFSSVRGFEALRGFSGIALFHLGLALRDELGDGFALRIDQQIFQILI